MLFCLLLTLFLFLLLLLVFAIFVSFSVTRGTEPIDFTRVIYYANTRPTANIHKIHYQWTYLSQESYRFLRSRVGIKRTLTTCIILLHTIHDKSPWHTWIRWHENTLPNGITRIGNSLSPPPPPTKL